MLTLTSNCFLEIGIGSESTSLDLSPISRLELVLIYLTEEKAGRIEIKLYDDVAPKVSTPSITLSDSLQTAANFRGLCAGKVSTVSLV